jgi:hypothetical protein
VAIKGGYAGFGEPDSNARNIGAYKTILSGDLSGNDRDVNALSELLTDPCRAENSYHVVTGSGCDESAMLNGVTITAGNANGTDPNSRGGGMYNNNGRPTITNCTFSENSASFGGGGMYNKEHSSPTVTKSTFSSNFATWAGGGMFNHLYSNPTLTNCILWGNEPNEIVDGALSSTIVTYSDVDGGWPGIGNIDADPCFADVDNGDCHLKSQAGRWDANSQMWVKDAVTSSGIDAGDYGSDWKGELWPHGERINMGAYGGTPEASMSLSDAGNIADLNIDGEVDYRDMKLLTNKWPYKALLQPEDLSRDGIVNFADFAIFSRILGLPGPASNPNPPDGAGLSNLDTDLSWTAGPYAESHDIYFGTSSPPPLAYNQTSTTFDPGTMAPGTKYYWRIDEVSACGTITGTVWSFTTMTRPP